MTSKSDRPAGRAVGRDGRGPASPDVAPDRPSRGAKPTRAQRRRSGIRNLKVARAVTQLAVAAFVLCVAVRHQTAAGDEAASVDAICPFGAVETLITWLTTGTLIAKIHPSNLILGAAVLVAALLVGNAFCGWICPFGAVQDALTWVRNKVGLRPVRVPERLAAVLGYGRFVVLAVVLWFSATTSRLWFADYDPYAILFSLHWWFEYSDELLVGLGVLAVVLLGSLIVDRLWCRFLCPLGAVFSVLGRFSLLRIRRDAATCTDCTLCDWPCPVGISVSTSAPLVSPDCVGCLDCVAACPVKGALQVSGPVMLGNVIRRDAHEPAVPAGTGARGGGGS